MARNSYFLNFMLLKASIIVTRKSYVESPQQNGRVGRKHQYVRRDLLYQSKLPLSFSSYAVLPDVFLSNIVTTTLLRNKSPYHMIHNNSPNVSTFKFFGCLCYATTLQSHGTKLQAQAIKSVFLS